MIRNSRRSRTKLPVAAVLAVALAAELLASPVRAEQPQEPAVADARGILMNMASFLASQQRFQVELACGYDAVQPSGKKIEFLETRTITADRPRRLRVELTRSDGDRSLVLIDGKTITAQNVTKNVYAQTDAKASLDESVIHFVQDLKMRFPLALLLLSTAPNELGNRLRDAQYVERTGILGTPTHHIVGSTDAVDFQIWVDAGKEPLPRRIVLTYPQEDGQPQFRAQFGEWDLSPRIRDSAFAFDAPKGAGRIQFVTQLQALAGAPGSAQPAQGATR